MPLWQLVIIEGNQNFINSSKIDQTFNDIKFEGRIHCVKNRVYKDRYCISHANVFLFVNTCTTRFAKAL